MDMNTFTMKIVRIFETRNWNDYTQKGLHQLLCIADKLTDEERDVLYELTNKYKIIMDSSYSSLLKKTLVQFGEKLESNIKNIFVMPLLAPEDINRTDKSSTFVCRYFQSPTLKACDCFENREIILNKSSKIHDFTDNSENLLLLVDDFVGTGDTAISCINSYLSKNIVTSRIILLTISIMESGKNRIERNGITVLAYDIEKKGISDFYPSEIVDQYFKIIDNVESRYEIPNEMKHGYKKSEGLISLMRTPNNTFPVFWHDKFITPPFPRY